MDEFRKALCDGLFRDGLIKFGKFHIKIHDEHPEAPLSPIYLDLRFLQRFPRLMASAVNCYERLLMNLDFEFLYGIPTAATPLTAILEYKLGIGMLTPRMIAKNHGSGAMIDGYVEETDRGCTVVVIDDLISNSKSKIEAIDIARNCGLIVNDVVVLVDREQGGAQQLLDQCQVKLHAFMTLSEMLSYYLDSGKINQTQLDDVNTGMEALRNFQP